MSAYDELPDAAFTDLERSAGVPGLIRGSGRRGKLARVTEADCIALIVRGLVTDELGAFELEVVHSDGETGDDYDLNALNGLTPSNLRHNGFVVIAHGYRVPSPPLLDALRNTGLPLFGGDAWVVWNPASQSLITNEGHLGSHWNRSSWITRPDGDVTPPKDPKRARVFELLRTAYLTSDFGKRPLLIRNEHLDAALAKKSVPFAEPRNITEEELHDFSLVYVNRFGDVSNLSLASAYAEDVPIACRACCFFRARSRRELRPSLTDSALKVNGFLMAVARDCERFTYYVRRNEGTVFQGIFERVDLPSGLRFKKVDPDSIANSALRISEWGRERNVKVYVTEQHHPLHSDDREVCTTVELYSAAIRVLQDLGFALGSGPGEERSTLYSTAHRAPVRFGEKPFAELWQPADA